MSKWSILLTAILALIFIGIGLTFLPWWLDANDTGWGKIDGTVYVRFNGTEVYRDRFDHSNAYCFGEYSKNESIKCKWQSPGCGSILVYCDAISEAELGRIMIGLDIYKKTMSGSWVQGQGIVCERKGI